jgi:hypothetical protein
VRSVGKGEIDLPLASASAMARSSLRKQCFQIVGEIHEVADQIRGLALRIADPFPRGHVPLGRGRFVRNRLRVGVMPVGLPAEPLPVAFFNELTHWELPALVRSGPQTREFLGIHAEGARHFDLPSIQPADLLRVPPCVLVVSSMLLRHATTSRQWHRNSKGTSFHLCVR